MDSTEIVKRIKKLANEQGRSMTYLCKKIGLSSRTYFNDIEKHNRQIPDDKLKIIAESLNTTVDYLLGKKQEKKSHSKLLTPSFTLTPHETAVITAYRTHPEMQPAVDRLLGVQEEEETVTLYSAAYSKEKAHDEIITIPKSEWERLKNLPTTDQDLL